ncbi:hypothetical protein F5X96DRAFT_678871 [Biscogniauxia mediterranea]|nr:hypothetical protein F5X96DRAFT_678871 [Biscogniauxia mediterranea]
MASQAYQAGVTLLSPFGPQGPPVTATPIIFSQTPLAEHYSSYFALVLDNLLTPAECAALQASVGNEWQSMHKGEAFRECQHIYAVSPEWSSSLFERISMYLPEEVKALRKGSELAENIVGSSNLKANVGAKKTVWRLKEANEKMSFLRYRPGHFFKPHCDGLYTRPGKDEKSFLTCQIYLSDAPEAVDEHTPAGGETRFWPSQEGKRHKPRSGAADDREMKETPFLDIKPKIGRALVFQQRMLWHSGQEVKMGEKFTVRLDLMYERHFEKFSNLPIS